MLLLEVIGQAANDASLDTWTEVPTSDLATYVVPVGIGVIMFALGLALTPADFRRVFTAPKGVAVGMLNLAIIAPALAFLMATLFDLPAELAVGLVLLGASPGGMMANMLTHLARGDTALSVTMTAISSIAAVVTIPLYLGLATSHFGVGEGQDPDALGVVMLVFAVTIIPVAAGLFVRQRYPEQVRERYGLVRAAAGVVFAIVVIGAIVTQNETVREYAPQVAGAALALNISAMAISFGIARLVRLGNAQSTAIALELGVHNAALAIAVGASLTAAFSIPAAVYSSFMLFTGGAFAWVMSRHNPPVASPVAVS